MSGPANTDDFMKAESLWSSLPDCFYEYRPDYFLRDLEAFDYAFRSKISSFQIALSVKTNYLQLLLKDGLKAGTWLEATSEAEYETSLRAGAKPENIILNGPAMRTPFMTKALVDGALLQIDNLTQWDAVRNFANEHKEHTWKIALRINAAVPQAWSRFGMDFNDAKTMAAFMGEAIPSNVEIIGFSFHHLTDDRSANQYGEKVRQLGFLWRKLFGERPMSYLNIGGGFLSNAAESYRKQFNFAWTEFSQYAEAVAAAMSCDTIFSETKVVAEPGIAVMASALALYTKITTQKVINNRNVLAAAGSVYDFKPTFHTKTPPFRIIRLKGCKPSEGEKMIVGSSCMEHDILLESFTGGLSVGDYLIFDEVGAYTLVLRPSFIEPAPAVYLYEAAGNSWRCIRERGQLPG